MREPPGKRASCDLRRYPSTPSSLRHGPARELDVSPRMSAICTELVERGSAVVVREPRKAAQPPVGCHDLLDLRHAVEPLRGARIDDLEHFIEAQIGAVEV